MNPQFNILKVIRLKNKMWVCSHVGRLEIFSNFESSHAKVALFSRQHTEEFIRVIFFCNLSYFLSCLVAIKFDIQLLKTFYPTFVGSYDLGVFFL